MKTKWIVVTGLDGSGKTHLVKSLEDHYKNKGLKVTSLHLPNDIHLQKDVLPVLNDPYSDRLLFALDNRIVAARINQWLMEQKYDIIISQRGWLDSYVHGRCQGFDYEFINGLNRFQDLPKADIMIHLVADAKIAYDRIKDDPDADKFEYLKYIVKQEKMTRQAYEDLMNEDPGMYPLFGAKNILIDTTEITIAETFKKAIDFLESLENNSN